MIGSVYGKMRREGEGQPVVGRPHRPFFAPKVSQFDGLLGTEKYPGTRSEKPDEARNGSQTIGAISSRHTRDSTPLLPPDSPTLKYPSPAFAYRSRMQDQVARMRATQALLLQKEMIRKMAMVR